VLNSVLVMQSTFRVRIVMAATGAGFRAAFREAALIEWLQRWVTMLLPFGHIRIRLRSRTTPA
jgi:hypothetical protein